MHQGHAYSASPSTAYAIAPQNHQFNSTLSSNTDSPQQASARPVQSNEPHDDGDEGGENVGYSPICYGLLLMEYM